MVLKLFELAFGSFLVSAAIGYAWWASVRATFLRENLFSIRDGLWDTARSLDGLSDPAHQNARRHLNSSIWVAAHLSPKTLSIMNAAATGNEVKSKKSRDSELQAAIDLAYEKSSEAVLKSVYLYSVSGWIAIAKNLLLIVWNGRQKHRSHDSQRQQTKILLQSPLTEQVWRVDRSARASGHTCGAA